MCVLCLLYSVLYSNLSFYIFTTKFMGIRSSPSPDTHGLEQAVHELYGVQHVGLVQMRRPDQASENPIPCPRLWKSIWDIHFQIKLWAAMQPFRRSICASRYMFGFFFSLRKDGCICLAVNMMALAVILAGSIACVPGFRTYYTGILVCSF